MAFNFFHIVLAMIGLGFLVFIHELGHYWVARRKGMRVEAFSIGFGRPIYSWMIDNVRWQICILPFGGYVKIAGMQKEGHLQPHEIADGFFGKGPLARIQVALAGPLVNIFFALAIFSLLWVMGGREKRFSELTNQIGWVDVQSDLYKKGIRAGDTIDQINGQKIQNFKDFLIASITSGENKTIQGYSHDYFTGTSTPFNYTLTQKKETSNKPQILGSIAPAQYLMYSAEDIPPNSAMIDSGIEDGDRILWVDGELVFSLPQLLSLVNESTVFLTVQRGDHVFQTKIPRVHLNDLKLSAWEKGELDDWQHEAGVKGKLQEIAFIPYSVSQQGVVESQFQFIDSKDQDRTFFQCFRSKYYTPLKEGDRILAVDGIQIQQSTDFLKLLQDRRVLIVVERDHQLKKLAPYNIAEKEFEEFNPKALHSIISSIGTDYFIKNQSNLYLLNPVIPKVFPVKQPQGQGPELLRLGVQLHDRSVIYNPSPLAEFGDVFGETWRTLKSLVTGKLSPKFVSGPIGIVTVMQQSWLFGAKEALFWIAVISFNLGMMNLLPIPVLDGGYIVLALWELIVRKPIQAKTLERLIIPFVVLLIAFFVFVTYQDISRLFSKFF